MIVPPYNLLVSRRWMLVVPRTHECFQSISFKPLSGSISVVVSRVAEVRFHSSSPFPAGTRSSSVRGFSGSLVPGWNLAAGLAVLISSLIGLTVAAGLIARGVMPEPDSREPWFICEALSDQDIAETATALEASVRAALD